MRSLLGVCLLGLLLSGWSVCAADDSPDIGKLIEQLGDDALAKRRAASKRLEEIGESALEQLREAEKKHSDPDVKLRAGLLVRAIEKNSWDEIRVIVGPTRGYWFNRIAFTPDGKQVRRVLEVVSARPGLALSKDGTHRPRSRCRLLARWSAGALL